ncbi:MAG: IscS subfamily cysteine desulfurase [Lachnospiraceae bacterium]|nr:IscS subfamily cysteine desulfurase [Lachnospiraceae bacterium]
MENSIRSVYADNAATTRPSERALTAFLEIQREYWGNPSSLYSAGQYAEEKLSEARRRIAVCLGAQAEEIYFTSCGTESDNHAIRSAAALGIKKGKHHIVSSAFEHHAVLHTLQQLEKEGFEVTYLPVHEDGLVREEELAAALREDTALVTIMFANNEIGTVQPIAGLGRLCRERGILFHTDAVQAAGHCRLDPAALNVDMLSISAHKFHGPKGIGALYVRRGVPLLPLLYGGAQERGRRPGTENVAGAAAMAAALEESLEGLEEKQARILALRERLIDGILTIEKSRLNGDRSRRLAGNANFCFEGIEGESLLLLLDDRGISASSGSACTSGSLDPSHVLLAIGLPHEIAHGSLRISLGEETTQEDVDYIVENVKEVVQYLRNMSPIWKR